MHTRRTRTLLQLCTLGALVIGVIGAALPERAQACTTVLTCNAPVRLFPPAASVPGNLIYFKVLVAEPGELVLRAGDGSVIPSSIRTIGSDRVFAPEAEVPAGEHVELIYTSACPPGASFPPSRQVFPFITSAAQPMELPKPSLTLADQGKTNQHPWAMNSTVGYVVLSYQASCTTCSAAHLTDNKFQVNGGTGPARVGELELLTSCEGLQVNNSCTGDLFAQAGHYDVEAWSDVVGAPTPPEHVQRDFNLNCSLNQYSNGGLDAPGQRKYKSGGDAELEDVEGCSLGGANEGGGSGLFGALWLGLVLLGWRRREPFAGR
jgi:hypothetical protein